MKSILKQITFLVCVVLLSLAISSTFAAWQEPTTSSPEGNVAAPVNVGDVAQTKSGGLTLQGDFTAPIFYDSDNASYYVNPAGQTVLAGSVGIGAASPSYKLDVNGTGRFIDDVRFAGGTTRFSGYESSVVGTKDVHIITSPANRGISIDLINNDAGDSFFVRSDASNGGVPDTVRFTVQSGGNVGIGTASPGAKLEVNGDVIADAFYYSSDESLKKDIKVLDNSSEKILELEGVSFNWKENGEASIGLIAQDVEKTFPEAVNVNSETGIKSINYGVLVAPLIETVKEQQEQIELLENRLEKLENHIY